MTRIRTDTESVKIRPIRVIRVPLYIVEATDAEFPLLSMNEVHSSSILQKLERLFNNYDIKLTASYQGRKNLIL